MKKICGVVVLYNPDLSVLTNIFSYINHIDLLYVVDNSEQKDPTIVTKLSKIAKIQYLDNDGNQGIANALNLAAIKAIEAGYQWLLTMDQDSSFSNEMIIAFLACFQHYKSKEKIAIFSPSHDFVGLNAINNQQCESTSQLIVMTSGNLLNLSTYPEIGGFKEKLFIDGVDHDYCLKAKKLGFSILQFQNILLNHELGEPKIIRRHGKEISFRTHSPQRFYYITRNSLYMWQAHRHAFPDFVNKRIFEIFKAIIFALIYDDQKILRLINVLRGIFHFIVGRYGK
ncbi:glycosyltransferase [Sulfuricurvum sp.]|uniref:glycosyltransferase n=1 Tax=Sulfuricurvum sp. TaxID=2025608 RepID=UPI003C3231AB